jgi:hypothetical protein
MTDFERRHARRFKLTNPVNYWWLTPSGSIQASHGMTLDISSGGVMILARKRPPKGARIQATIHVAGHDCSDCPLELHGEGIVVRIEPGRATQPGQGSCGFAALVHFYSELPNDSDGQEKNTFEP